MAKSLGKLIGKLICIAFDVTVALAVVGVTDPPKWIRVSMAVTLLLITGMKAITADDD